MNLITESGTFSKGSATNSTVILETPGFRPDLIFFFLTSAGGSDSLGRLSIGFMHDGLGDEMAFSTYGDSTGHRSVLTTLLALVHQSRVSGTVVDFIQAKKVSFDVEEFTLDFDAASSANQIGFLAIGVT